METSRDNFEDPQPLIQVVNLINSIVPRMRWARLQTAAENSCASRVSSSRVVPTCPASKRVRIKNSTKTAVDFSVEWSAPGSMPEHILADGQDCLDSNSEAAATRILFYLLPGASRTLEYRQTNEFGLSKANRRAGWRAKAFARRRLSEMRDNVLCRAPSPPFRCENRSREKASCLLALLHGCAARLCVSLESG